MVLAKLTAMPHAPTSRPRTLAYVGGDILLPDGVLDDTAILIDDGVIVAIGEPVPPRTREVRLDRQLILPGIVDLHGDAVERALCPRPGVHLPLAMALRENDAALIANGITTSYCSITDSFEPGLRGRGVVRAFVEALTGPERIGLACQTLVHLRHEVCLTEGHDELVEWLATGRIHLLSTADHLSEADDHVKLGRFLSGIRRRISTSDAEIDRIIAAALAARPLGREQCAELASIAVGLGIPLASHDDESMASVDAGVARGVRICEFPASLPVARYARARGQAVLLGAPNYVRGGSHVGWMGVAEALAGDALDCLCSDYHYPSVFHAPFRMAAIGARSLAAAWALVSDAPARAAGLDGRKGRIAPGYDADLLVVDASAEVPRLAAVVAGGVEVARFAPVTARTSTRAEARPSAASAHSVS